MYIYIYIHTYIQICIYIYIYIYRNLIGSVRKLIRRGSACVVRMRRGSVRSGSASGSVPRPVPRPVPRSVPAGSEIQRFGSIRFGGFGSVSYRNWAQVQTLNAFCY